MIVIKIKKNNVYNNKKNNIDKDGNKNNNNTGNIRIMKIIRKR